MTATERLPALTTLHWVVLGLVSMWEIGLPERLADEIGVELTEVEAVCRDLEALGWIQRVETH